MKRIGMALALALALGFGSAPAGAFESAAADATRFSAERILKNGPSMDGSESAETSKKCVRNGRSMNGRKMNGRRMNGESMGDSGAMLIGLLLAAATISLTGQVSPTDLYQQYGAFLPMLLPFVVLFIPLADLLLAVVRRTKAGRAPWAPDKQHLHHRLLELGHSQRRAVLIMYVCSALIGAGVVALSVAQGPLIVVSIGGSLAVFVLLVVSLPKLRASHRSHRAV